MKKSAALILLAALAFAPMGGGSLAASPPPSGGTISIEPRTTDGDYDAALRPFADGAAEALAARGFTILDDDGHAAYVAELLLSRSEVGTGRAKAPGGNAVSVVGTGVVVPLPGGKSELVPLQRTRLEIRIRRRGETDVIWDGAAVTIRAGGTRNGSDEKIASDLSQAILQSYPAEPKDVVGVP